MKSKQTVKQEVVVSVEEFEKMTSSDIVKLLTENEDYRIVGDIVGKDRHIISVNKQ